MMNRQTLLDKWVRKQPRFEMTPTDQHGNRECSARGGPSSSTDTRETVERAPGKRTLTGKVTATTRTRVIKVLQINLNNCKDAHYLLMHTLMERGVDVALVSEPYLKKGGGKWAISGNGLTGIWVKDPKTAEMVTPRIEGITGVEVQGITFLSVYFSGNKPAGEYEEYLTRVGSLVRGRRKTIVAGDLNAKSVMWGEKGGRDSEEKERAETTEAFIIQHELEVANIGNEPTCVRHNGESIVDITLHTEDAEIEEWRVKEEETFSDHRYIEYGVLLESDNLNDTARQETIFKGWKVTNEALPELERALRTNFQLMDATLEAEETAAQAVESYTKMVHRTCDDVLRPRKPPPEHKAAYWWNEEIGRIRAECTGIRRKTKRAAKSESRRGEREALATELREKKKELKRAIARSKKVKWDELLGDLERDPWTKAYQIVMGKIGGKKQDIGKVDMDAVVSELFPRDDHDWYEESEDLTVDGEVIPPFSPEEMSVAIARLTKKRKKAPGPDHFTNEIVKASYNADPERLMDLYNRCLKERSFPEQWKVGRLALLPKPGSQKKFRPITLLSTYGKLYETLLNNRIKNELANSGYLSNMQFGFREGKSTGDALKTMKRKMRGARSGKRFCCVVSFDIKNAFNTITWKSILEGMAKAGLPLYLQAIVKEYGANRTLLYTDQDGTEKRYVTNRGVPQGSVLGPTLWILTYNTVLRIAESDTRILIGFADDTLLIITSDNPYELEDICNALIQEVEAEVERLGCTFAGEKTQALFISPKREVTSEHLNVRVAGVQVSFSTTIKYLGVIVDDKLSFGQHVEYATQKAKQLCGKLTGITRNLKGPKERKRKLYSTVINQVLLYAAPIWYPGLAKKHREKLNKVQRLANLRQTQSYITVSGNSAGALAGNPPADLLAEEAVSLEEEVARIKLNEVATRAEKRGAIKMAKKVERKRTMEKWNRRWKEDVNNWTKKLCADLSTINRKVLRNGFRTTQLLTGKGVFNSYRKAIGKCDTDTCWYCPGYEDTPEHTLFECRNWTEQRAKLTRVVSEFRPDGELLARLTESEETWRAFENFAEEVMGAKEEEERRLQAYERERDRGRRCTIM